MVVLTSVHVSVLVIVSLDSRK